MELIVVTGLSGSGKSCALQALEDLDYYCVDNLPLTLLSVFATQMVSGVQRIQRAAIGIDARNINEDLQHLPPLLEEFKGSGLSCKVLFLDADDKTLVQRFSTTRRKHPLSRLGCSLTEAIARERVLLRPMLESAVRIDTSHSNIHQLHERVREYVKGTTLNGMTLLFLSFAYKNGIPIDADFVFDMRCLPNPHWDPELRPFTGQDPRVIQFFQASPLVERIQEELESFLQTWIPRFEADHRSYMTVALGCTGGRHRSVYLAELLAEHFRCIRDNVLIAHREIS